jgi:hypothetical protein
MNFNPLFLLVYGSVNHTYLTAVLLLCCCNLACMSPCLHRLSRSTELFCIKCCFDRLESRGNIWSKEAMDRFYSWHYFCCVDVELTMIDASQLHASSERGSIRFLVALVFKSPWSTDHSSMSPATSMSTDLSCIIFLFVDCVLHGASLELSKRIWLIQVVRRVHAKLLMSFFSNQSCLGTSLGLWSPDFVRIRLASFFK